MNEILKMFDLTPLDLKMIAVWAVAFVVLWKLMGRFFILPYMRLVEAREAATIAARETAVELTRSADELQLEYDRRISSERGRFLQQKQESLDRVKAEADSILESAERDSRQYRDAFRGELQRELQDLKSAAASQTGSVAAMLVEKLKKIPQEASPGK